jgi:glycosyltransferase involved in cell wall biosynthesis
MLRTALDASNPPLVAPQRIALIAPPWLPVPPPAYGGTEWAIDLLARGLVAAGHHVLLCASADSTCPVPSAECPTPSRGLRAPTTHDEIAHATWAWERAIAWGADVVHDHTMVGPALGKGLAPAVVTTNHHPFTAANRAWFGRLADAVAVIALSAHHAATAKQVPIAAVIHHGVDPSALQPGPGDGGYAAFVGRMSPDKGIDRAIRVAREADVPLRIAAKISDAHEHAYFSEVIAPLLGGSVAYLGELGLADKTELLRHATCLVNPLRWDEPFGMVMAEALACGTPVVATPTGSVPELVDHGVTGWLGTSTQELVTGVRRAADLSRRACRSVALERFSPERVTAAHLALYAPLADHAAASRNVA